MVTDKQRKLILRLIKIGAFDYHTNLRNIEITAKWPYNIVLTRIKNAQVVDNLHHAPCCPANHFHRQRLVFQKCTCGANTEMGG